MIDELHQSRRNENLSNSNRETLSLIVIGQIHLQKGISVDRSYPPQYNEILSNSNREKLGPIVIG